MNCYFLSIPPAKGSDSLANHPDRRSRVSPPERIGTTFTGITGYVVRHITGDPGGNGPKAARW